MFDPHLNDDAICAAVRAARTAGRLIAARDGDANLLTNGFWMLRLRADHEAFDSRVLFPDGWEAVDLCDGRNNARAATKCAIPETWAKVVAQATTSLTWSHWLYEYDVAIESNHGRAFLLPDRAPILVNGRYLDLLMTDPGDGENWRWMGSAPGAVVVGWQGDAPVAAIMPLVPGSHQTRLVPLFDRVAELAR